MIEVVETGTNPSQNETPARALPRVQCKFFFPKMNQKIQKRQLLEKTSNLLYGKSIKFSVELDISTKQFFERDSSR